MKAGSKILCISLVSTLIAGNLICTIAYGVTLRDEVDKFKTIQSNTGPIAEKEKKLAQKAAALEPINEKSSEEAWEQHRQENYALTSVLADPNFYKRDGSFEIFKIILTSNMVRFFYINDGIDIINALIDMIDRPDSPGLDEISNLLKILVTKEAPFTSRKIGINIGETPLDRLIRVAQEKSKTESMKLLFDVARTYFARHGDSGDDASAAIQYLAKGPITKDVIEFAKDLAEYYVDNSVVPDGPLKKAIIKASSGAFNLWTVEKAVKELEDLMPDGDMEIIKKHAYKVAKFSRNSVEKSLEKKTLNKRTLQILANPKFLKRQGAEKVVRILLVGHTIDNINETVLVEGEWRQLLPTYIANVIQQPGGETEKKISNVTYIINYVGCDTSAPIEYGGKTMPVYAYLAKKAVSDPDAFETPVERVAHMISPKQTFQPTRLDILDGVLGTIAKETKNIAGSTNNKEIVDLASRLINYGANARLVPAGTLRNNIKAEFENPNSPVSQQRQYDKKDQLFLPDKPTKKDTVDETIDEIQKQLKNNNMQEVKELAEDLKFFDQSGVSSPTQVDKKVGELFSSKKVVQNIPGAAGIVSTMIDNQVISNVNQVIQNIDKTVAREVEKKSMQTKKIEALSKEETPQKSLQLLATSCKALLEQQTVGVL